MVSLKRLSLNACHCQNHCEERYGFRDTHYDHVLRKAFILFYQGLTRAGRDFSLDYCREKQRKSRGKAVSQIKHTGWVCKGGCSKRAHQDEAVKSLGQRISSKGN